MTMQETEIDILKDLEELGDTISQYSFLIACAGECRPFEDSLRIEGNLVKECQMKTWLSAYAENGIVHFAADSESLIVKGALALLQEIYDDRTLEEVKEYRCGLLDNQLFTRHFHRDQLTGVMAIIGRLGRLYQNEYANGR